MGIEDFDQVIQDTQTVLIVTDQMDLEEEANFEMIEFLANSSYAKFFDISSDENKDFDQRDDTSILFELKKSLLLPEPPTINKLGEAGINYPNI